MILVYIICILTTIAMCAWYFVVDVRKSIVQNMMLLAVAASSLGYLSLALSTDLSGAILSNKIVYLGGCFLPMLYFLTVCEICHVRLKTWLITVMSLFQVGIYLLVCSIGYLPLYYKTQHFEMLDGVGVLVKEYGPLHFLYPDSLFLYVALSIGIAFYTAMKKKNIFLKGIIFMLVGSVTTTVVYAVERTLNYKYELTPVFFLLLLSSSLIPIYLSDLYTVEENEDVIREQLSDVGFLTFSNVFTYMGANAYTLNLFPELNNLNYGEQILHPSEQLGVAIHDLQSFLGQYRQERGHVHLPGSSLRIGDRIYETEIHSLQKPYGGCAGATIVIRDITEHQRMLELTEHYNEELNRDVEDKTRQIRSIQEKTILGMAQMVESRDLSTGGHIKRTSDVVRIFADRLKRTDIGLDDHFLDLVIRSAPMHDLGKIGVDDAVLRKRGRFTDEEYAIMKRHAEIGGRMVREILTGVEDDDFVQVAYHVANYHHEKVNGKGYPMGLKGEEIPIDARIMALADVFDALVSKRCYKEAFPYDKAFEIIRNDAGEHFDKRLAELFLQCREDLENYYDQIPEAAVEEG